MTTYYVLGIDEIEGLIPRFQSLNRHRRERESAGIKPFFMPVVFPLLVAIAALEKAASRLGAKNRDSLAYTPRANEDSLGMGLPYCAGNGWDRLHGKLIIPVMRDLVFACLVLQRWNEEGSYLDYLHP